MTHKFSTFSKLRLQSLRRNLEAETFLYLHLLNAKNDYSQLKD